MRHRVTKNPADIAQWSHTHFVPSCDCNLHEFFSRKFRVSHQSPTQRVYRSNQQLWFSCLPFENDKSMFRRYRSEFVGTIAIPVVFRILSPSHTERLILFSIRSLAESKYSRDSCKIVHIFHFVRCCLFRAAVVTCVRCTYRSITMSREGNKSESNYCRVVSFLVILGQQLVQYETFTFFPA